MHRSRTVALQKRREVMGWAGLWSDWWVEGGAQIAKKQVYADSA